MIIPFGEEIAWAINRLGCGWVFVLMFAVVIAGTLVSVVIDVYKGKRSLLWLAPIGLILTLFIISSRAAEQEKSERTRTALLQDLQKEVALRRLYLGKDPGVPPLEVKERESLRMAMDRTASMTGMAPYEELQYASLSPAEQLDFLLQMNCPCGSGRKFSQCHDWGNEAAC